MLIKTTIHKSEFFDSKIILIRQFEETSREVARHWKIGDAKNNRGILIAIAVKDKKLRIETSNESFW